MLLLLLVLSWALFSAGPYRGQRRVLTLAVIYYNGGNYGLPLVSLAFGDDGLTVLTLILTVQNLAGFTLGLWLIGGGRQAWPEVLKGFLNVPAVYAILGGLLLKAGDIQLAQPLRDPLTYLADGMIPIALMTLGVQLARGRIGGHLVAVSTVSLVRLVLSPLLAAGLVTMWAFFLSPEIWSIAPILIAVAGVPTAVGVYIFSIEYKRDPDLASQIIFWTTLLSAFTMTLWLMLYR